MKELITINNVRGYLDENGTAHLNLEDVSRGLGFVQIKNDVEYVRWETIFGYLDEIGFSRQVGKEDFIPESIFYKLCFKASNEIARKFQDTVTDEILPSIRKTGGYVNNDNLFISTYLPFADETTKQLFSVTLHTVREQNRIIQTRVYQNLTIFLVDL